MSAFVLSAIIRDVLLQEVLDVVDGHPDFLKVRIPPTFGSLLLPHTPGRSVIVLRRSPCIQELRIVKRRKNLRTCFLAVVAQLLTGLLLDCNFSASSPIFPTGWLYAFSSMQHSCTGAQSHIWFEVHFDFVAMEFLAVLFQLVQSTLCSMVLLLHRESFALSGVWERMNPPQKLRNHTVARAYASTAFKDQIASGFLVIYKGFTMLIISSVGENRI